MGSAGFGWSGDKDFLGGGEADWFTPLPDTPEPNPATKSDIKQRKREESIQIKTHNKHCELN